MRLLSSPADRLSPHCDHTAPSSGDTQTDRRDRDRQADTQTGWRQTDRQTHSGQTRGVSTGKEK